MSEELPREEGLPAESEESERWISNLFSALPEGRPNLFSLGVRAAERTEISRVRVCATCRRSLDKLNFSRTQWNKKQVGVSRCWECVSSDLEAPEASERWTTEAEADVPREPFDWYRRRALERAREREVRRNEDYDAEAAERRPGQRTAAQRHNKEERTVPCCYVFLCGLLECLECACFFCWLTS